MSARNRVSTMNQLRTGSRMRREEWVGCIYASAEVGRRVAGWDAIIWSFS
jgi:hypothetical protein